MIGWRRRFALCVSADWLNCFNIIYKMDSKIGFEMNLIVVEAIRGRCASFTVLTALNGFGDIWWTDNPIYFSRA